MVEPNGRTYRAEMWGLKKKVLHVENLEQVLVHSKHSTSVSYLLFSKFSLLNIIYM